MILCLGTTPTMQRTMVVERLRIDEVNRAIFTEEFASGKAVNVGRTVQALGEKPLVVAFAGGHRGDLLRAGLDAMGMEHELIRVAAPTRLCLTLVDRSNHTATELVEESSAVERGDWDRLNAAMDRLARQAGVWVFSGSLPPGGPADTYARWAPVAKKYGARLIVDARGEPLRLAMQNPGVIVKVNRDELVATLGFELNDESSLIRAMRSSTPAGGAMIVTAGKQGSWLSDGQGIWHFVPPAIPVVNPIGSGDAYAGGLAVGLGRKMSLIDACRLATACAAANAMTQNAGQINASDIAKLLEKVEARQI